METYNIKNFPYELWDKTEVEPRGKGNPGRSKQNAYWYKARLCAFDIETTTMIKPRAHIKPDADYMTGRIALRGSYEWDDITQAVMYVWQFYIEGIGVVIGRTWEEFTIFMDKITEHMASDERVLVLVHNLSYEFQFLRGVLHFRPQDVFCVKARKILRAMAYTDKVEFRCTYLQTNMSLDRFTKAMGVEHQKLHNFDYQKERYYDTALTEDEIAYITHDVVGLVEAFRVRMQQGGDTIYTVPLTSTGYCRRDAKAAVKADMTRKQIEATLPDYRTYCLLREAFRGGNTHASRFYAGITLHNVHSVDRASSYPDVLLNRKFPVTAFYEAAPDTIKALDSYSKRGRAWVMKAEFCGLRLSDPYRTGCPYLPLSKCQKMPVSSRVIDNGRVLEADYVVTAMTDVDFQIFRDQYTWDEMKIVDFRHARYGYLTASFRALVVEYFRRKTSLKNVRGAELDYRHAKELINALYGMTAQDVSKAMMIYDEESDDLYHIEDDTSPIKTLQENQRRSFMSYAVGVWTTAWARYELQLMIDNVGAGFVYTDTDSVKYVGDADWSAYNDRVRAESIKNGGYADDPAGVTHYLGVAESEHDMCEFKTLGAKKYAYRETEGGELYITIAGVGKTAGGKELDAAGGLDAMREGFVFYEAGGLESHYNDHPVGKWIRHDGKVIRYTSNVCLTESTYELGLSGEYKLILSECAKRGRFMFA